MIRDQALREIAFAEDLRKRLADAVRPMTERVTARYVPRALLTSLEGTRLAELVGSAIR